jgi:hypothetical protein
VFRTNKPAQRHRAFRPEAELLESINLLTSHSVAAFVSAPPLPAQVKLAVLPSWSWSRDGAILEIGYRQGASSWPQFGALDVNSGYLRLLPSTTAGWATSVVVLPSLWVKGVLYQGAPLQFQSVSTFGADLMIKYTARIATLQCSGTLLLSPPAGGVLQAHVSMSISGQAVLDSRSGEAFKTVMLSSMHISNQLWDASAAVVNGRTIAIPTAGWICQPPLVGQTFGLRGGTSSWKAHAPTVMVTSDRSLEITGWVTQSSNPNDDNIGMWAASMTSQVIPNYSYTITVRQA